MLVATPCPAAHSQHLQENTQVSYPTSTASTKFTAYTDALGLGGVLDCEDDVTTAQQKRLYSLLILALPEAALHVICKVERKSATAGNDAWEAL